MLQRVGADGAWHELDNTESLHAATMDKWRRTQYLEFAERVSNQYSGCDPEWRKGKAATAILGHIEAAHNDV